MKKVTAIIVGYHDKPYLKACFRSLQAQDFWNLEIIFVDNASYDGSARLVSEICPEAQVVNLQENIGYAAANNLAVCLSKGDFILTMNPDVSLRPDYVQRLADHLEQHEELGGVQGKLYKAELKGDELVATDKLDSTGDIIYKDRHTLSRGQGELDQGQYDDRPWVFSLTGAAAMFRREMLDDIALDSQYFDEDFFAYKEDIDLCWRARLLGWDFAYLPAAVGSHARGWGNHREDISSSADLTERETSNKDDFSHRVSRILSARSEASDLMKFHSYKNRHLMMMKNEQPLSFILHLPAILLFELGMLAYILWRERKLLRSFGTIWQLRKKMKAKRRQIMQKRKIDVKQTLQWFR